MDHRKDHSCIVGLVFVGMFTEPLSSSGYVSRCWNVFTEPLPISGHICHYYRPVVKLLFSLCFYMVNHIVSMSVEGS
jgi:hypothetical protein